MPWCPVSTALRGWIVRRYDASGAREAIDSGIPDAGSLREPGLTSKGDTSPSSFAISRVAGITSFAIMRMLVSRASDEMGPSFCQNPKIPGRRTSSTLRILGITVLGAPAGPDSPYRDRNHCGLSDP